MTAGPYAAAAGLVGRFADAFCSAVPADPRDDGFFGPASVTWRVSADLSAPVAGLRSLLMQALHPLVMAGVDQHSRWRLDPVGRLAATSAYVAAITYGDQATARGAARRVRAVHEEELAGLWQDATDAAVCALPGWARHMYGCPAAARLTPRRRIEIRQALGVLDAAILASPACSRRGSGSHYGSVRPRG